ncbi:unnamed protein product [Ranitomeya imitator]|uniref:Uncharacterized protein n=1 Tax=Ranitomeya imitator TaxID=111125 RepID=A0ABN9LXM8_9NEOB|nr:unnamed protein product [Ranitomeya imitator]
MFWAGIMGKQLVGSFKVPEGVKMTSVKGGSPNACVPYSPPGFDPSTALIPPACILPAARSGSKIWCATKYNNFDIYLNVQMECTASSASCCTSAAQLLTSILWVALSILFCLQFLGHQCCQCSCASNTNCSIIPAAAGCGEGGGGGSDFSLMNELLSLWDPVTMLTRRWTGVVFYGVYRYVNICMRMGNNVPWQIEYESVLFSLSLSKQDVVFFLIKGM